jgi:hypothetical protein
MGLLLGLPRFKDTAQLKTMNRELSASQRRDHKVQREAVVEGSILWAVFVGNQSPESSNIIAWYLTTASLLGQTT